MINQYKILLSVTGIPFFKTSSHWEKSAEGGIASVIQQIADKIYDKDGLLSDQSVLRLSDNGGCNAQLMDACAC